MSLIENDVPVPPRAGLRGRPPKYPWARMRVGDSFFVPKMKAASLQSTSKRWAAKCGKFTVRAEDGGARVWRIA